MSIETKWIIGLFVLMALGSILDIIASGGASSSSMNNLLTSATAFGNSFDSFSMKTVGDVFFTGGSFLFSLLQYIAICIFWNFSFLTGGWLILQVIMILVNIALMIKIMFDVFRALKPFGS